MKNNEWFTNNSTPHNQFGQTPETSSHCNCFWCLKYQRTETGTAAESWGCVLARVWDFDKTANMQGCDWRHFFIAVLQQSELSVTLQHVIITDTFYCSDWVLDVFLRQTWPGNSDQIQTALDQGHTWCKQNGWPKRRRCALPLNKLNLHYCGGDKPQYSREW